MRYLLAFVVFVGVTFWGNFMASVRTVSKSPFWMAKLRWADDGVARETLRSTKISRNEPATVALAVAQEMEAILRSNQKVGIDDFEKLLARLIHAGKKGEIAHRPTFDSFSQDWIMQQDIKASSRARYCTAIQLFKSHLGPLSKADIRKITPAHFSGFYNLLIEQGRSPNTAAMLIKPIRTMFQQAHTLQMIQVNPAAILRLRTVRRKLREPFTAEDIKKIFAYLKKFPEWELAAMFGFLFGMRIRDAVSRRYDEIQTIAGHRCLVFVPQKRERLGKPVTLPLVGPLAELQGEGAITPTLQKTSNVSRSFSKLLAASGVAITHSSKEGAGHSLASKSFHSFRHTLNSNLAANGVDISLRQAICGHDSIAVSLGYTHANVQNMAAAIQGIFQK
jgi:site-specific recombinase XerD